jgi:hypothetical protein
MADEAAQRQRLAYEEERKLGEECEIFLRSDAVQTFLDGAEESALAVALAQPLDADLLRFRALTVLQTVRLLRAFMAKAVQDGVYSAKMLEAEMKRDGAHAS